MLALLPSPAPATRAGPDVRLLQAIPPPLPSGQPPTLPDEVRQLRATCAALLKQFTCTSHLTASSPPAYGLTAGTVRQWKPLLLQSALAWLPPGHLQAPM